MNCFFMIFLAVPYYWKQILEKYFAVLPFCPFFLAVSPDPDFFEEIGRDLHPVLPFRRIFARKVQGYNDGKMFLSFHYNISSKLLCTRI